MHVSLCGYLCTVPMEARRGTRFPRAGVTYRWLGATCYGCWALNLGPLQEQYTLHHRPIFPVPVLFYFWISFMSTNKLTRKSSEFPSLTMPSSLPVPTVCFSVTYW